MKLQYDEKQLEKYVDWMMEYHYDIHLGEDEKFFLSLIEEMKMGGVVIDNTNQAAKNNKDFQEIVSYLFSLYIAGEIPSLIIWE